MSHDDYHALYRIVLLGDAGVGKTCMIQNFVKGSNAIQTFKPTLGIEYSSKNIELTNNHIVKAQIWDTAGQQNYRSVTVEQLRFFMRKAEGALVVFDVTNRKTFNSVQYWIQTLRERALDENVQIVLVGNKIDRSQYRSVSLDEAEDMARNFKVSYRETAVSDSSTLVSAFRDISERILKSKNGEKAAREVGVGLPPVQAEKVEGTGRKGCC